MLQSRISIISITLSDRCQNNYPLNATFTSLLSRAIGFLETFSVRRGSREDEEGGEERKKERSVSWKIAETTAYVGREGRGEEAEAKRDPQSRCWTGRGDPVGSTGSQRLSGSSVPTIGGGPGGEVSRASPLAREALGSA